MSKQQKPSLPPAGNIADCLAKPPNTPVPKLTAIVVKVNDPKAYTSKDGRPGTRIVVKLRDPTGEINYTFFNPPKVPELNDIVEITNGYVKPPYQPGGPNEIGLSQFPKDGVNPECKILGKGQAPPAVQPQPAPVQDPAAAFFGLQPKPGQQPAPPMNQAPVQQQLPAWTQPPVQVMQQAPVIPSWATGNQSQLPQAPVQQPVPIPAPQPAPIPTPQPASEPEDIGQYPDGDAICKADVVQATMTVAENILNLGLRIEEGFKQTNANLASIFGELQCAGVEIDSKFDQIFARLIKHGIPAPEIFTGLAKIATDTKGLVDPKIAIGIFATDKGIDISDIAGDK